MMRTILTALLTVLAMSLTVSETIGAQEQDGSEASVQREGGGDTRGDRQRHRAPDPEKMVSGITRRLELDDLQVQQVRNIIDAAKPEFVALREKGKENHMARRALDVADADYAAESDALARTRKELADSSKALRVRMRTEINAVLTPEQQAKFAELNEKPRGERRRGRQRHRESAEIG